MNVHDGDDRVPEVAGRAGSGRSVPDVSCPRNPERPTGPGHVYRITVLGELDGHWSEWFGGLRVSSERESDGSAVTTLSGTVADQAALRGILVGLWDLNVVLLSVLRIEEDSGERKVER